MSTDGMRGVIHRLLTVATISMFPHNCPADSPARHEGWFDYVAVVHPVDKSALQHMLGQGYGNPFIHHLTWGLVPPERTGDDDFEYASCVVPFMVEKRKVIGDAIGDAPGTLIIALPENVLAQPEI